MSDHTPERIYLIPDGECGHVWCADPAPGLDMDPADAVAYVRADRIEAMEAERDQLRAILAAIEADGTEEHNAAVALRNENARLREALDFYACIDHYEGHKHAEPMEVRRDRGHRARAALDPTPETAEQCPSPRERTVTNPDGSTWVDKGWG